MTEIHGWVHISLICRYHVDKKVIWDKKAFFFFKWSIDVKQVEMNGIIPSDRIILGLKIENLYIIAHIITKNRLFTFLMKSFSQNPWRIPRHTLHTFKLEFLEAMLPSSIMETLPFPFWLRLSIPSIPSSSSCSRIFLGGGFGTSKTNSSFSVSRNFCSSLSNSWKVNFKKSNNPKGKTKHENRSENYDRSQIYTMLIYINSGAIN